LRLLNLVRFKHAFICDFACKFTLYFRLRLIKDIRVFEHRKFVGAIPPVFQVKSLHFYFWLWNFFESARFWFFKNCG
jgi:hypothetical protein